MGQPIGQSAVMLICIDRTGRREVMKGIVISLIVFVGYVLVTAILCHIFHPPRHSKLFFPVMYLFLPLYCVVYGVTPQNLYIFPPTWLAEAVWLDAIGGLLILILNIFSYINWFFGFNGGFSMSLMLELLRTGNQGLNTAELTQRYLLRNNNMDKILGWRVPRLEETGYLVMDRQTGVCRLTGKGRVIAWLTYFSKRLLNLGEGG